MSLWEQCAPGAKARLQFECPRPSQGVRPVLPVLVARGYSEGPLLLVVAGQHGRELHGPAGIARVFDALDPAVIKGTVVFLPVLNPVAMRMHSQDYPMETARYRSSVSTNCNMNRKWGLDEDSYAGIIATSVAEHFVDHADAVIDLHGWATVSSAWGGAVDRDLVLAFGLRVSQLRPPDVPPIANMFEGYVQSKGIPFMLAELAPQNILHCKTIGECENGLLNVMRHLNILEGSLVLPKEQILTMMGCKETLMSSSKEGLCEPLVEQGDTVCCGQLLARLWSLDSFKVIEEYVSPHDGIVLNMLRMGPGEDTPASAIVHPGTHVVLVRELGDKICNRS